MIVETKYAGVSALEYSIDELNIILLPDIGAKIVSLQDLRSGKEWMARGVETPRALEALTDQWAQYDKGGWDECFPSIAPGFYPFAPWTGVPLRDHGELWQRPWVWRQSDGALITSIYGLRFPYHFERTLSLENDRLSVRYRVTNLSEAEFVSMWAMHVLLHVLPGVKLHLRSGTNMIVEFDTDGNSQYRQEVTWPKIGRANSDERDLSVMGVPDEGVGLKLFAKRGEVTCAAVEDPEEGAWIGFTVDPLQVPYVGVWMNEGRWPTPDQGLYHVAIEPSSGFADHLEHAHRLASVAVLGGHGGVATWNVSMVFGTRDEPVLEFVSRG
jgi:hypothetical protein